MNLKEFNSLVDLFFYKATKENPNADFLEWLNPKNKKKYTWGKTSTSIQKLAKVLKDNLGKELLKETIRIKQVRDIFGIRAVDEVRTELNIS